MENQHNNVMLEKYSIFTIIKRKNSLVSYQC